MTGSLKKTIAGRAMGRMALRLVVVTLLVTGLAYLHFLDALRDKYLDSLSKYADQRARSEQALFELATDNHRQLVQAYLRKLRLVSDQEAESFFGSELEQGDDGAYRHASHRRNIEGTAQLFISHQAEISLDLKKRVLVALELLKQYGPALRTRFQNTYFVLPEHGVALYWPEHDDWVRQYTSQITKLDSYPWFYVADAKHNPQRKSAWTDLYLDDSQEWMVSVSTPIYLDGRHIVSVNHDIVLDQLLERTISEHLDGAYNLLLTREGKLVAHPKHQGLNTHGVEDFNQSILSSPRFAETVRIAKSYVPGGEIIQNTITADHLAVRQIAGPRWYFVVGVPERVFEDAAAGAASSILLLGAFALLLEVFLLWFVLRKEVGQPLAILTQAADEMASGAEPAKLSTHREDEIGELSRSFQHMQTAVQNKVSELLDEVAARLSVEEQLQERNASLQDEVSQRKQLQQRLRALLTQAEALIYMVDGAGNYLLGNPHFESFFALELAPDADENLYQHLPESIALSWQKQDLQVFISGEAYRAEVKFRYQAKEHSYWMNKFALLGDDGEIDAVCCIAADIGERVTLEEQLRQAQKMEAIGRLAGGIAHDFNNLLVVISGNAQLIRGEQDTSHLTKELCEEVVIASKKASELTRQLLAFSRKQQVRPQVIDVNERLRVLRGMLDRLLGDEIELTVGFCSSLNPARIYIDPSQWEQVVLNLVSNAKDALPKGGQVSIAVDIKPDAVDSEKEAGWVVVSVKDSGDGIPKEIKDKIFEPFFTTKEVGKGTGLGLATVHGIVTEADGKLLVEAAEGGGTAFHIYLPQSREELETEALSMNLSRDSSLSKNTILVVEDQSAVKRLMVRALEGAGYTVLAADNGEQALQMLRTHPAVELLISDVSMPVMNGPSLLRKIENLYPLLTCALISGFVDERVDLDPNWPLLDKPFTPEALIEFVEGLLRSQRPR